MGVPKTIPPQHTPAQLEWLAGVMAKFLPSSMRIKGIMNDVLGHFDQVRLEMAAFIRQHTVELRPAVLFISDRMG